MKDEHKPSGPWKFDAEVTAVFDDMLRRSIPQYDTMRAACFDLACKFQVKGADIVDLGCSRGEAMAPLIDRFGAMNRFVGVEISESMLETCRTRFAGYINSGVVDIRNDDLRSGYPPVNACVTLSILTIQFTPIEHRQRIVRNIFDHTRSGGALIIVEKILGGTSEVNELLADLYYQFKQGNGYSREDIDRKRLALEGVLVPVTAKWNEEILRSAGFRSVECFWRWMNFAGWIALK